MADVTWRYELTRDGVQTLQHELEWALQRQNRRFAKGMRDRANPIQLRLIRGLSIVCIVLLAVDAALDPDQLRAFPLLNLAALAVSIVAFVIATVRMRKGPPADKPQLGVGGMLSRQAAGIYRKPAQQVPYTIDYTLADGRVRSVAPAVAVDRSFDLRKAKLVLHSEHALFVFRFKWSFQPMRFVYASGEAERAALLAVLDAANIEHAAITGPVENYVAPIPGARAL
jgi:hypothetical protein